MTDKQFDDAFTAAGGWFILTQFEIIVDWKGEKSNLIDELYEKGFDKKRTGTTTRVSSIMRILENNRGKEALEIIRDSTNINRIHPEAKKIAEDIIKQRF